MSATIKTLKTKTKDGTEQSIYPKSVLEAIIDTETEKTLDIIINNLEEAKITVGTSANYGHVKLSDNYTTSDGVADEGVGASSKAVSDAYNEIKEKLGTINEENSNYFKIGNYVIQWGFYENMTIYNARVLTGVVNLPVPFLDTNFVSLGGAIFSMNVTNTLVNHMDNTVTVVHDSNTKLGLRVYNPNNSFTTDNITKYPINVRWIAIGRWR